MSETTHPASRRRPFVPIAPSTKHLLAIAGTVLAAALGLLSALQPAAALGAVLGLVVLTIVFADVTVGLCVWIVFAFTEDMPAVAGAASTTKAVGLVLVVGWLCSYAVASPEERTRRDILSAHPALAWMLSLFLAWSLSSSLWAESPADARSWTVRFALNFVLFLVVFAAIRKPRHIEAVFIVFIAGALISSGVGLVRGSGASADRLSGSGLNPNALGDLLMVAVVLGFGLVGSRRLPTWGRWAAALASLVCIMLLFTTASRGAAVGLIVALLAAPFLAGRGRRLYVVGLVVVTVLTAAVWVTAFAPPELVQRYTSPDTSGTGRVDIWKVGWRIVQDRPMTGIGAGNFKTSAVHYLLEPGRIVRDDFILDKPHVPHNIYLHVLTELGVVGLAVFVGILAYCLACGIRAARLFSDAGDTSSEMLARALVVALVGLLSAYFFSSQLLGKQLYLLLACCPAMLTVARSVAARAADAGR